MPDDADVIPSIFGKTIVTAIERPFDDYRKCSSRQRLRLPQELRPKCASIDHVGDRTEDTTGSSLSLFRTSPIRSILLDFACGSGRVLELLEGHVGKATGVDVTESMLEVAADVTERSRLVHADITRSDDLDGEQFDLITAFRFFPNAELDLRHEAMAKLATLLAPGGIPDFQQSHQNRQHAPPS